MTAGSDRDGVLVEWGDRLFYPGNRSVKAYTPKLGWGTSRGRAMRERIEATIRGAPQVMVKVTGGGRGMKAIAAHLRYITKNGRLEIEDDRGSIEQGKDALRGIEKQWQFGGAHIEDVGHRREAFNVMLSMPRGTPPEAVRLAARDFAKLEFADHRYVMVLHDHQAHPHVHLTVKAESRHGKRLNPRKADLHRWREAFAEQLRERGVDAEASRQVTRGAHRRRPDLWQVKALEDGRLRVPRLAAPPTEAAKRTRRAALEAWKQIALDLERSGSREDRALAEGIAAFARGEAPPREHARVSTTTGVVQREVDRGSQRAPGATRADGKGPEIRR